MANYQIVEKPFLFPQRTIFTNDPREIEVIDTGVELPDEGGRVYVSFDEAAEIAQLIGYVSRGEYESLQAENDALKLQLAHLPEVIERTINAIRDAATAAVVDLVADDGDDSGADNPVPAAEPQRTSRPGQASRKDAALASEQGRPSL